MDKISSAKNQTVKRLRALSERKHRLATGMFLVEGEKLIREALAAGLKAHEALATEVHEAFAEELAAAHVRCYLATDEVLSAACETVTPQGVCASFDMPAGMEAGDLPERIVALDGVQDPGNLGTIWRTADAAGFGALLLGKGCADPFSPKVQRSSMGSGFRIGVMFSEGLADTLEGLRRDGYTVISSALDGGDFYSLPDPGKKFVLVIGNEARGISREVLAASDLIGKLPMRGGAESLNAAVAAGIMMYELTRKL